MKNRLTTLIFSCFLAVGCDLPGSNEELYEMTLPDGTTINLLTDIYQETSSTASYKFNMAFELGVFPDIEFAKRYQSNLSESKYESFAQLWRARNFAYDSIILPVLWFRNSETSSVLCNFSGNLELREDQTDEVVWKIETVELCNGNFPKASWESSNQLSGVTIETKNLKPAPSTYTLTLAMQDKDGVKINLIKPLQINAKPSVEQLVARSKANHGSATPQIFTTTSQELTQWSNQEITRENWLEIYKNTLVASVEPGKTIYATVAIHQAGVDPAGQSNQTVNYTIFDAEAKPLLRARGLPLWSGAALGKDTVRLAQSPLAISAPDLKAGSFFINAEVFDFVTGKINEMTSEITLKRTNSTEH